MTDLHALENELDISSTYLLKGSEKELRETVKNWPWMGERVIRAKNLLKAMEEVPEYARAEMAYNLLDGLMLLLDVYGPKSIQKVGELIDPSYRPLLKIIEWDARKLGLDDINLQSYERVKSDRDTNFHRLYSEMAPFSEILRVYNEIKEKNLRDGIGRAVRGLELAIERKRRVASSAQSIPYIAAAYGTISALQNLSPIAGLGSGLTSLLTLGGFSISRELLTRNLERCGNRAIHRLERCLNKINWSLPYLLILGTEYLYSISPLPYSSLLAITPKTLLLYLSYTWGIPLMLRAYGKIKRGYYKFKAVSAAMREIHRRGDLPQIESSQTIIAKKFEELCSSLDRVLPQRLLRAKARIKSTIHYLRKLSPIYEVALEARARPPKGVSGGQGLCKKIRRYLSTPRLLLRQRLSTEEIEEIKRNVVSYLERLYRPEIVKLLKDHYLPYIKVGEEELNRARGITPTVYGTVRFNRLKGVRKLGESGYRLASPKSQILRHLVDGYVRDRAREGFRIEVKKRLGNRWMGEPYERNILDYEGDFKICATGAGQERLIFGMEGGCGEGEVIGDLEIKVRSGLMAQIPRMALIDNKLTIVYDLVDPEIFITDLFPPATTTLVLLEELKHVGNLLDLDRTIKEFGLLLKLGYKM